MALIVGGTLWLLISLAFLLDSLNAARALIRALMAMLAAEFVFVIVAVERAECAGPCFGEEGLIQATGLFAALAFYVIPGLAGAFTLYLVAYGLRRRRATGT